MNTNNVGLSLLLLAFSSLAFGQKKELDTSVYRSWPQTDAAAISPDGRYVAYLITNPMASANQLVIQSTISNWKISFATQVPINPNIFTSDSRFAVFMQRSETLVLIDLKVKKTDVLTGVKSSAIQAKGYWLTYQIDQRYILRNTSTGQQFSIDNAEKLDLPNQGNVIYYWTNSKSPKQKDLYAFDLASQQYKRIWTGIPTGSLIFSDVYNQLAFTGKSDSSSNNDIWYYQQSKDIKVNNLRFKDTDGQMRVSLQSVDGFDHNGTALSITIQKDTQLTPIKKINMVSLDVWSYQDYQLQSEQPSERSPGDPTMHALLGLHNPVIIQITHQNELIIAKSIPYTLVKWIDPRAGFEEFHARWNPYNGSRYYLVSNKDGSRKQLSIPLNAEINLSPLGEYVIFTNIAGHYCSYTTATGEVKDLTKDINTDWSVISISNPLTKYGPRSASNLLWTAGDRNFMICDRFDIWKVDPEGKKLPLNLTNGYGKHNHIRFDIADYSQNSVSDVKPLILRAFNTETKESGFFKLVSGISSDPVQLNMGPYVYYGPANGPWFGRDDCLVKASGTGLYLIGRMSTTASPNYFLTTDFKSFRPMSNVYPEQKFNWVKSELINWKQPDGAQLQGILYKPESFDPTKKYPLIFCYYEKVSDDLNLYITPEPTIKMLNAPFYAANDYLVFYPDIIKKPGEPGQSAFDAVISAASYLSKRSYVDSTRLGLYGMSLGAFETNYIITHSKLFAAAGSVSGMTDFICGSGELSDLGKGGSYQEHFAFGQPAMGQYLWENPELYLKNSPVAYANRVSTPVLIMANKLDARVSFNHGIEFFTALRILGKKAWLLQYDNGGHGIDFKDHPDDAIDFDVRLKEFYDFYLKSKPAPLWMLNGIPRYLKGTETGIELDTTGRTPGPGLPQLKEIQTNQMHY